MHIIGIKNKKNSHFIPGFNAVKEALLKGQNRIDMLWIAEGKRSYRAREIIRMAGERDIPVQFKKSPILDKLMTGIAHQGIVALAEKFTYFDLDYIMDISLADPGHALIIMADHITDEGNLGALRVQDLDGHLVRVRSVAIGDREHDGVGGRVRCLGVRQRYRRIGAGGDLGAVERPRVGERIPIGVVGG